MIPTLEIDDAGNITTLYTDEIDLYALGQVHSVRRASHLDFNEEKQIWEVVNAATGEIVHSDKNRSKAIEWEVVNFSPGGKYYEK